MVPYWLSTNQSEASLAEPLAIHLIVKSEPA